MLLNPSQLSDISLTGKLISASNRIFCYNRACNLISNICTVKWDNSPKKHKGWQSLYLHNHQYAHKFNNACVYNLKANTITNQNENTQAKPSDVSAGIEKEGEWSLILYIYQALSLPVYSIIHK